MLKLFIVVSRPCMCNVALVKSQTCLVNIVSNSSCSVCITFNKKEKNNKKKSHWTEWGQKKNPRKEVIRRCTRWTFSCIFELWELCLNWNVEECRLEKFYSQAPRVRIRGGCCELRMVRYLRKWDVSLPHEGHSMVWVQLKYHTSEKHFESVCDFLYKPTSS